MTTQRAVTSRLWRRTQRVNIAITCSTSPEPITLYAYAVNVWRKAPYGIHRKSVKADG